ncbi:SGNH/GDSL hydrolase family protein [Singulisphaera sp. PoT]|uniref:SGNH/GDSL hydrolase family protein n=1 Tax=Singulisphaera sp. PoT TaxID=3411797 RepID=UPI003BF52CF2
MNTSPEGTRPFRICFALTILILSLGLIPMPSGWARGRSMIDSAKSNEMNRADREVNAGGYYQSLIGGDGPDGAPAELTMRLLGKPADWARFRAANVTRNLDDDFLIFELRPNVNRMLFGQPFTTNSFGMRDREYTVEKPAETYRIAVLGSSMDMGWGVGTESTYVNQLEDWLNAHAAKRGLSRRFEVLNFAVAAYSPEQRLEAFRRKALAFRPDLVLYSATLLDTRLMEIHICGLFECSLDLTYDFIAKGVADSGLTPKDLKLDSSDRLRNKDLVKKKLRPHYWEIYDATLKALAAECKSIGAPLACTIIPRVGKADAPDVRGPMLADLRSVLTRYADHLLDVTDAFDDVDPVTIEIAAWDDHPNTEGHKILFRALARAIVDDSSLYATLFDGEKGDAPVAHSTPSQPKDDGHPPLAEVKVND